MDVRAWTSDVPSFAALRYQLFCTRCTNHALANHFSDPVFLGLSLTILPVSLPKDLKHLLYENPAMPRPEAVNAKKYATPSALYTGVLPPRI